MQVERRLIESLRRSIYIRAASQNAARASAIVASARRLAVWASGFVQRDWWLMR